jgi:hypothetical protein
MFGKQIGSGKCLFGEEPEIPSDILARKNNNLTGFEKFGVTCQVLTNGTVLTIVIPVMLLMVMKIQQNPRGGHQQSRSQNQTTGISNPGSHKSIPKHILRILRYFLSLSMAEILSTIFKTTQADPLHSADLRQQYGHEADTGKQNHPGYSGLDSRGCFYR